MEKLLSIDAIGYLAATLSAIALLPQALLTWKKRRAEGISLGSCIITIGSTVSWVAYGICLKAAPIIISNSLVLTIGVFILAMKIIYK